MPTSWEELADPRWKGQLAIEAGDVNWYAALRDYWLEQGKSEEEVDRLFEAIAGNALVVRGHTLLGQLMAAGEFAMGPNYLSRVDTFRKEGAPLAWQPAVEPLFPEPQGVGVVEGGPAPRGCAVVRRLAARRSSTPPRGAGSRPGAPRSRRRAHSRSPRNRCGRDRCRSGSSDPAVRPAHPSRPRGRGLDDRSEPDHLGGRLDPVDHVKRQDLACSGRVGLSIARRGACPRHARRRPSFPCSPARRSARPAPSRSRLVRPARRPPG